MKLIDLTNKKFGRLMVIERDFEYQKRKGLDKPHWRCRCDCGNIITVSGKSLRDGNTKSCGCLQKEKVSKLNFHNKINQRFGKLVVEKYLGNSKWLCRCDCGNYTEVSSTHLTTGHTTSCGCIRSKGELFIKNWLRENNFNYKQEYTIENLRNSNGNLVRFDFAIFNSNNELKYLIEYNGRQHYDKNDNWYKEIVNEGDNIKQEYCSKNNIPLYIISYDENLKYVFNEIDFSEIRE